VKDFEPISLTNNTPFLIVARSSIPANDLRGLIDWLRANPDKGLAATAGVGSMAHVNSILLQNATGTRFQLIPYRGNAQALQDVVAGQIDFMFDSPSTSLAQVRAGKIKALAVTDPHRLAVAPEIPTTEEAGLPGFTCLYWQSLWAPKGTPKDIVNRLNAVIVKVLADPATRSRFAELGLDSFPRDQQTPEALSRWQRREIEKWGSIIKAAGIKAE
jgi:tripartite-type tricarboxylate transporter receptor subunit TctC